MELSGEQDRPVELRVWCKRQIIKERVTQIVQNSNRWKYRLVQSFIM